jgi:hypothetical protein
MRIDPRRLSLALAAAVLCAASPPARGLAQQTTPSTTTRTTTPSADGTRTTRTTGEARPSGADGAAGAAAGGAPGTGDAAGSERPAPDDDGRSADILWIEATGGWSYVNLRQVSYDNLYPELVPVTGSGPTVGVAAGVRIKFLTIGARATFASYEGFDVGTVGGEITLRLPTPVVEPYVRAGIAYAGVGEANYAMFSASTVSVNGWIAQAALGLDVYLNRFLAVGAAFDVDVLNLSRQPATASGAMMLAGVDLSRDGNAVGLRLGGHLAASLHF